MKPSDEGQCATHTQNDQRREKSSTEALCAKGYLDAKQLLPNSAERPKEGCKNVKPIFRGCAGTRYGCFADGKT